MSVPSPLSPARLLCFLLLLLPMFAAPVLAQELPPPHLETSSYALSSDGKLLGYFGPRHRVPVLQLRDICGYVPAALLATEDRDFYQHDGVSLKGLGRAVLMTVTGSKQGGSTLTMQLARNLYLSREQTVSRKMTEIKIAMELEKRYSKNDLLLLYLNCMFYGRGAYGIWAASQEFFSKTPDRLSLLESATLVGLLNAPSAYDPVTAPEKALSRRNAVLHNLVEVGKLSESEYQRVKNQPLGLRLRERTGEAFLEHVRREAAAILSRMGKTLESESWAVLTTLDTRLQSAAEAAVNEQWATFPVSMRSAQLGMISLDVNSGCIRAMIAGSPGSNPAGLNHVTQIKRQPGSSFKPFLYGQLLDKGYSLATPLENQPITITVAGQEWSPENDDGSTSGPLPLKQAIQMSLNLASAYAITRLTTPEEVADFAHRCGIVSRLNPVPSLALGTSDVSPLEMAAAFSVFPAGGIYSKPFSITRISDSHGREMYREDGQRHRAISPETAYLTTYALEGVVNAGTASRIRKEYKGPAAGKTGTTQSNTDAWFVGFNPDLATAIWVGHDSPRQRLNASMGYGGTACAPIWGKYMARAARFGFGGKTFRVPDGVIDMEMCTESGQMVVEGCPTALTVPVNNAQGIEECSLHGHGAPATPQPPPTMARPAPTPIPPAQPKPNGNSSSRGQVPPTGRRPQPSRMDGFSR